MLTLLPQKNRRVLAALGAATLMATGCGDVATGPTDRHDASRATLPSAYAARAAAEQSTVEVLAAGIARTLRDPSIRAKVRDDMRDSRVREHKLHFTRYLRGQDRSFVRALARTLNMTDSAAVATVATVRELEFYMPVQKHRQSWTGDANIIVAVQLHRRDTPVAYTPAGQRVALSLASAPSTPTLVLAPAETNFDADTVRAAVTGLGQRSLGQTIERAAPAGGPRFLRACEQTDPDCGSGGGAREVVPASAPAGLYMVRSSVYNTQEPWTRGNPELEMHIISRYGPAKDRAGTVLCSGDRVSDQRRWYDQNDNTWSGAVLLLSDTDAQYYNYVNGAPDGERFLMQMWEDDYSACRIYTTSQIAERALYRLGWGTALDWLSLLCAGNRPPPAELFACGITLYVGTWWILQGAWDTVQDVFGGEDDLVGTVIPNDVAQQRGITPDQFTTHTLIDADGRRAGGLVLMRKDAGQALYSIW